MNFSVFNSLSTPASPRLNEPDLRAIVEHLDGALEVFRRYDGRMSAADIRIRSMLTVLRDELNGQRGGFGTEPVAQAV